MSYDKYLKLMNYTIVILMHLAVVLVAVGGTMSLVSIILYLIGVASAKYALIYGVVGLVTGLVCGVIGILLSMWRVEQA